ncbi:MAG: hypothetical protein ACRCXB_20790 [Aeromonadaceae bacterium]
MIHALITMALAAMAWPFGWHTEAAAMSAAFYCGREHAQAEYRAISALYGGKRANAPWWCGFTPSAWDAKSIFDFFIPILVFVSIVFIQ